MEMFELNSNRALKSAAGRPIVIRWIDGKGDERITETRGSVSENLKRAIAKEGGEIVEIVDWYAYEARQARRVGMIG
jgi:hypothetical protein